MRLSKEREAEIEALLDQFIGRSNIHPNKAELLAVWEVRQELIAVRAERDALLKAGTLHLEAMRAAYGGEDDPPQWAEPFIETYSEVKADIQGAGGAP